MTRKSETRRFIDRSKRLALAQMNVNSSRADTYRKRELDMTAAWSRVERAQTRLWLDREYLVKIGKEPR